MSEAKAYDRHLETGHDGRREAFEEMVVETRDEEREMLEEAIAVILKGVETAAQRHTWAIIRASASGLQTDFNEEVRQSVALDARIGVAAARLAGMMLGRAK